MFSVVYFPPRYFAGVYFAEAGSGVLPTGPGGYFATNYFSPNYYAADYFSEPGVATVSGPLAWLSATVAADPFAATVAPDPLTATVAGT